MKIKLTQNQADFITQTFSCKGDNFNPTTEKCDDIYFQVMSFTQYSEDKGTCLFEMNHISELPKDAILYILNCIVNQ
jgi:hypothetical protein